MSIFSKISAKRPRSNTFDLSHDRKFSMDMGTIVPILCMDLVPGDKVKGSTAQMVRFAPMLAPIMHQVQCKTAFFFVPNRLVWSNWESFITGGTEGTAEPVFPTVQGTYAQGTIGDYLGLPSGQGDGYVGDVSAIPFAAYGLIWYEYFRDQNMLPDSDFSIRDMFKLSDGLQTNADFLDWCQAPPRPKAWQHDYFTSALPWTQRGPQATIPLLGEAEVSGDVGVKPGVISPDIVRSVLDPFNRGEHLTAGAGGTGPTTDANLTIDSGGTPVEAYLDPQNLGVLDGFADLSTATAATINDLRRAMKLQEFLEKNARGGSRYIEVIQSHFGVRSKDSRLQRPEFLGGGRSPVVISEVLQTSQSADTPQANMAGHGINVGKSHQFSYYATEHGYVIGLMWVMPKSAYFQGIPKHFRKFDKLDYYWPSFARLGEQPVINWELYYTGPGGDGLDDEVFGYVPRYAEYKYIPSSVHGDFRSNLLFWHMARKFDNRPLLNDSFVNEPPTKRIFAVTDPSNKLWCHLSNKIFARRPMPYFGTPTL